LPIAVVLLTDRAGVLPPLLVFFFPSVAIFKWTWPVPLNKFTANSHWSNLGFLFLLALVPPFFLVRRIPKNLANKEYTLMHTARGITKNNQMDGNTLPTVGRYTKGCVRLCESAWAEVIEIKREEVGILRVCDEEGNQFRRYIVECWVLNIHVLDISRSLNDREKERWDVQERRDCLGCTFSKGEDGIRRIEVVEAILAEGGIQRTQLV